MRWYKIDKPYIGKNPKVGDKKIKKHFCLFPKSFYNKGATAYIWLETVYIVYELKEGYECCTSCGEWDYQPDYWEEIGVALSYDAATSERWIII